MDQATSKLEITAKTVIRRIGNSWGNYPLVRVIVRAITCARYEEVFISIPQELGAYTSIAWFHTSRAQGDTSRTGYRKIN